jgi:hypothetical protein
MIKFVKLLPAYILFISTSYASVNIQIDNDKKIHDLMIGSWVTSPKDELYTKNYGSIATYKSDGTLNYKQFTDTTCTIHVSTLKARWSINDGKLVIVVSKEHQITYGLPPTIIDIVHEITNNNAILINTEGRFQHRVKSEKCI